VDGQFGNNAFSGTLSGLDYAMDRVEVLSLAENDLTGPLPNSFGDGNGGWTAAPFLSLRELHLYRNRLSSTVPPGLLSGGVRCCPNLTSLLLGGHEITGELTPAGEEGKGSALVHLLGGTRRTCVVDGTGGIGQAQARVSSFSIIFSALSVFRGSVLTRVGPPIRPVSPRNNRLAGMIPSLSNLVRLEMLYFQNNKCEEGTRFERGARVEKP